MTVACHERLAVTIGVLTVQLSLIGLLGGCGGREPNRGGASLVEFPAATSCPIVYEGKYTNYYWKEMVDAIDRKAGSDLADQAAKAVHRLRNGVNNEKSGGNAREIEVFELLLGQEDPLGRSLFEVSQLVSTTNANDWLDWAMLASFQEGWHASTRKMVAWAIIDWVLKGKPTYILAQGLTRSVEPEEVSQISDTDLRTRALRFIRDSAEAYYEGNMGEAGPEWAGRHLEKYGWTNEVKYIRDMYERNMSTRRKLREQEEKDVAAWEKKHGKK